MFGQNELRRTRSFPQRPSGYFRNAQNHDSNRIVCANNGNDMPASENFAENGFSSSRNSTFCLNEMEQALPSYNDANDDAIEKRDDYDNSMSDLYKKSKKNWVKQFAGKTRFYSREYSEIVDRDYQFIVRDGVCQRSVASQTVCDHINPCKCLLEDIYKLVEVGDDFDWTAKTYPANGDANETEQEDEQSENDSECFEIAEVDERYHESYHLDLVLAQSIRPPTQFNWRPNAPFHINRLNEYCMGNIFKQFPMQSLIRLRIVCRQWFWNIHRLLRSKQSIKLFGNRDDLFWYCEDLPRLNLDRSHEFVLHPARGLADDDMVARPSSINVLPRLFPNVTRLLICNFQSYWQHNLIIAIGVLPKLRSLTLYAPHQFNISPGKLWSAINAMPSLSELHLLHMTESIDLPRHINALSRLEEFTLTHYVYRNVVNALPLLLQLGPTLRRLRLHNVTLSLVDLETFINHNYGFIARNLTHLNIGHVEDRQGRSIDYRRLFRLIGTNMISLVYLDILYFQECPVVDLLEELSPLTQLGEISINLDYRPAVLVDIAREIRLPTVKRLWLAGFPNLEIEKFLSNFSAKFPALDFLRVSSFDDNLLGGIRRCCDNDGAELRRYFVHLRPQNVRLLHPPMHLKEAMPTIMRYYSHAGRFLRPYITHMFDKYPPYIHVDRNYGGEFSDILGTDDEDSDDDDSSLTTRSDLFDDFAYADEDPNFGNF